MKQLELFEISFEEKRFLKMIRVLEKKTDEIDLLKYELAHLKTKLEGQINEIYQGFIDSEEFFDLTFEDLEPPTELIKLH